MVVGTLHTLADIGNVGENGTTVTLTQALGRGNLVGLGAAGEEVGVVALDEGEEPRDEERVGDGLSGIVGPDTSAGLGVTLGDDLLASLLTGLLGDTGLSQLSLEVTSVELLGLGGALLLLFQGGGVELGVAGGGFLIAFGFLGGLLGLLLLGETLEHVGDLVDLLVWNFHRIC